LNLLHCAALLVLAGGMALPAVGQEKSIVLASTTSTEQSGLFTYLLPLFRQASGIEVRVVAVGTGQALALARRGDADALLVHDTVAEEQFVKDGFALERKPVMYNDFVLVGPAADPARVRGQDIAVALARLHASDAIFVSRGDKSGTHAMELRLWPMAGVDPTGLRPKGYRECGCGMGPALNMAAALSGYALTDRATWLAFKNRADLQVLVEGDPRLFNPYGVMAVNPARHPHVKYALAQTFVDWMVSPAGQGAIAAYRIGGQPAFFPDARPAPR
jgi:tungstate transport system substrate-binding protein